MVEKASQCLGGVAIKNTWIGGIPLVLQVVVGQPHGRGGTQLGVLVSLLNEMKQLFFVTLLHLLNFYIA